MEQRTVIRFFTLNGRKAREIQTELKSVSGSEALALSTVKKWRKRLQGGRTEFMDDPRPGRPVTQDLAEAIQSMLPERPLVKFHLDWIPHAPTAEHKSDRVSYSRQLLAIREQQEPIDLEYVITGDESWFSSYNRPDAA